MREPEFPLRAIFDDGEVVEIDSPDAIFDTFDTIDTADPAVKVWVRDALDRTVRLRMTAGFVEILEV